MSHASIRQAQQALDEANVYLDNAKAEGRPLLHSERAKVDSLLATAERLKGQAAISAGMDARFAGSGFRSSTGLSGGPGDVFVASAGYKSIQDSSARPQQWSSGPVTVSQYPLSMKGTMLESNQGGPGGGPVPPMYETGGVAKLFEPLGVSDLFGSSTTTASQVRYVVEGTATSAATGVAEGGVKPESTITVSEVNEPVKKIAHTLSISDELLEDAPSIQSYLNERLSLFVSIEEERQLLRGAGTDALIGLLNRTGGQAINQYTRVSTDDNATALARALANTRGSSQLDCDAIILHPSNWLATRLIRDGLGGTAGNFLGGGPFTGAYGNAGATGLFGQALWNVPVVLSSVVGPGTALIGAFKLGAHVWRRSGVSVEVSNSHSDYFARNLNLLRAEERLGLGVFRPSAFTEIRGLV
jgi:HK97 family phage major capsid protein